MHNLNLQSYEKFVFDLILFCTVTYIEIAIVNVYGEDRSDSFTKWPCSPIKRIAVIKKWKSDFQSIVDSRSWTLRNLSRMKSFLVKCYCRQNNNRRETTIQHQSGRIKLFSWPLPYRSFHASLAFYCQWWTIIQIV